VQEVIFTLPPGMPPVDAHQMDGIRAFQEAQNTAGMDNLAERKKIRKAQRREREAVLEENKARDKMDAAGRLQQVAVAPHVEIALSDEQIKVREDAKIVSIAFAMEVRPPWTSLVTNDEWRPLATGVGKNARFRDDHATHGLSNIQLMVFALMPKQDRVVCIFCWGEDHVSDKCRTNTGITCGYPYCEQPTAHSTAYCPTVMGRCEECQHRGHIANTGQCGKPGNWELFENYARTPWLTMFRRRPGGAALGYFPILTISALKALEAQMSYDDLCMMEEPDALKVVQHMMKVDSHSLQAEPCYTEFCLRDAFRTMYAQRKMHTHSLSQGGFRHYRENKRQRDQDDVPRQSHPHHSVPFEPRGHPRGRAPRVRGDRGDRGRSSYRGARGRGDARDDPNCTVQSGGYQAPHNYRGFQGGYRGDHDRGRGGGRPYFI
jgi:hypothetical protein